MPCAAGIAAAHRSHVKYFPSLDAYGKYYDFTCETGLIAVEQFAETAHTLLVEHLRSVYGDECANWARDYWTGKRGRMTLAHCRMSGCNNNMGVEVSWRLIKALCDIGCALGVFLGHLCHFIKTALGDEHRNALIKAGTPNAFIRKPIVIKGMWDAVQEAHAKTHSCCILLECSKCSEERYFSLVEEMMACGERTTPLHLKMVINHEKFAARGESVYIDWCDYKLVLVPRQNLLKKLDPDGTRSVAEMREQLRPMANAYERLVLHDIRAPGLDIREALKIYSNFHLIRYMPAWVENDIPLACTCKICVNHCVCDDTLLFAALFKPEVRVPSDYVAATVNLRKRCKSLKGAVGRKRMRILEEQKCNEKVIDSKVKYMRGTSVARRSRRTSPMSG